MLASDSENIKCVTRYGLWFARMASPMGCSVQYCCSKYGFTVDDMPKLSGRSIVEHYIHRADPAVIVRVQSIVEYVAGADFYSEWVILFESARL